MNDVFWHTKKLRPALIEKWSRNGWLLFFISTDSVHAMNPSCFPICSFSVKDKTTLTICVVMDTQGPEQFFSTIWQDINSYKLQKTKLLKISLQGVAVRDWSTTAFHPSTLYRALHSWWRGLHNPYHIECLTRVCAATRGCTVFRKFRSSIPQQIQFSDMHMKKKQYFSHNRMNFSCVFTSH